MAPGRPRPQRPLSTPVPVRLETRLRWDGLDPMALVCGRLGVETAEPWARKPGGWYVGGFSPGSPRVNRERRRRGGPPTRAGTGGGGEAGASSAVRGLPACRDRRVAFRQGGSEGARGPAGPWVGRGGGSGGSSSIGRALSYRGRRLTRSRRGRGPRAEKGLRAAGRHVRPFASRRARLRRAIAVWCITRDSCGPQHQENRGVRPWMGQRRGGEW